MNHPKLILELRNIERHSGSPIELRDALKRALDGYTVALNELDDANDKEWLESCLDPGG